MAVLLAGAYLLGVPGADTLSGEGRMSARASDSTALLLDRLVRLPDLTAAARASGAPDRHAELERQRREHDTAKRPYRISMPYRHPPRPCSSGVHSVPSVKHTLVNPARKETVELWEAELHEAEAHGAALPAAVARFLEALGPSAARAPQRLSFRFNSAEFVKDGAETTLTLYPLWQDAQRPAPKGFEDDIRAFRMSEDEFAPFYKAIARLDPARYAMLTDTDFEPAPPDLHHFERLTYRDNGREVVNWGYASTWLKDPALRQPLIALEQRVHAWAKAHPAAERPHAPFERLVLRDVQGREGGRSVYIGADGSVTVQIVTPAETGLHERLYEFSLAPGQLQALLTLLEKHPLARVRIPARPGIPDQARPEISLIGSGGKITTVTKWDDDRQPDFDAIYMYLLELEQAVHTRTPVREGVHDPDWRPE